MPRAQHSNPQARPKARSRASAADQRVQNRAKSAKARSQNRPSAAPKGTSQQKRPAYGSGSQPAAAPRSAYPGAAQAPQRTVPPGYVGVRQVNPAAVSPSPPAPASPAMERRRKRAKRASRIPFIVVLVFSLASACIMAFGNPYLWAPAAEGAQNAQADGQVVLGESQTASQSSDPGRAANLAVAAYQLDGKVIMPGSTLSLNAVLGDTENDEAYAEAPAFDDDSIVYERGGGICQVATSLYVAALRADLDVLERHPHTMACDYIALGLDATISYGQKDLVLRNSGTTPVRVRASAQGQTVQVSILGSPREDGATFDAVSRVTNSYTAVPDSAPEGAGEEWAGEEQTYYIAESYKVKYVDGTARETTFIAADAYLMPSDAAGEPGGSETGEPAR